MGLSRARHKVAEPTGRGVERTGIVIQKAPTRKAGERMYAEPGPLYAFFLRLRLGLRFVEISDLCTWTRRRVRSVMRSRGVLGLRFGVIVSFSGPEAGVYG